MAAHDEFTAIHGQMKQVGPEVPRVRPAFAAVVFGLPALAIFLVSVLQSTTVYEYLAGFAWAGSLFAVALRGFRNEEKDAFAEMRSRNANLAPVLLAIFGIVAFLESEPGPGFFLSLLAVAWTFVAPAWRAIWISEPVRLIGNFLSFAKLIVFVVLLAMIVWSWLGEI